MLIIFRLQVSWSFSVLWFPALHVSISSSELRAVAAQCQWDGQSELKRTIFQHFFLIKTMIIKNYRWLKLLIIKQVYIWIKHRPGLWDGFVPQTMVFTGPKITWRYELVSLQRGSDNKSSVHHITWDGAVTGILTHVTVPLVMLVLFIVTWSSHGAMLSPLDTKCPEAPSSYQVASVSLSHGLSESITSAVKLLS